ncbi:MAG: hypothetical protein AAB048_01560 [Planctomycetota bacterium]
MPEERKFKSALYGKLSKPPKPGIFAVELTPEQQEKLHELCSKAGVEPKQLVIELVEGKIAPASVMFGLAG